ncbi:IS3 family transposase [Allobaculum sp. Allo2]|uniref:IS3 family transposase n=1 Tax=Allobaculum sp. Allo2 TaxID=2853432 RepID=UPI0034634451
MIRQSSGRAECPTLPISSPRARKRPVIMDPENVLTVTELCAMNGVSRSGYYSWCAQTESREQREARDRADFELILQAFRKARGHAGARQIQMILLHQSPSIRFNMKKIRRLMRKFNLECPIRKANPYRRIAKALRTDNVSENLVRREFEEHGPRTILLTDITYIPYQGSLPIFQRFLMPAPNRSWLTESATISRLTLFWRQ